MTEPIELPRAYQEVYEYPRTPGLARRIARALVSLVVIPIGLAGVVQLLALAAYLFHRTWP